MSDSPGYLTPDNITKATFETKRKGFDPDAVKSHLAKAAATVAGLQDERDSLANEIQSLQAALADAQAQAEASASSANTQPLNDEELTERLGQDAVRVLSEARAAAADRVEEAKAEAEAIRSSAEEAFARRSADADIEAQRIRSTADAFVVKRRNEAEEAAAAILASAEANAELARNEVSSEMEMADADATRIIREAELARRQILEDLARRRSAARRQIEQLRAGRERLLASHETVRRALDEISEELKISMSEARAAAETAGHSVSDTTIEELEAEIETARLTGLLDTGPLPVVERSKPPALADTGPIPVVEPTKAPEEPASSPAQAPVEPATVEAVESAEATSDQPNADSADAELVSEEAASASETPADDSSAGDDAAAKLEAEPTVDTNEDAPTEVDPKTGDLAPVVQLDRARGEVDTASHPAKGRDAATRTPSAVQSSPALPSKKAVEAKEKARQKSGTVTKLESVKSEPSPDGGADAADDDGGEAGEVDDLFASLRSAAEKPAPKKKKPAAKKSGAKKKSATAKSAPSAKKSKAEPEIDSSEMARRFKRVLADEQSKAMSTVKGAEEVPDLEGLLGSNDAHIETYWVEVLGQVDDPSDATDDARSSVAGLVKAIRRRVGDALENAGDDKEAAVASLRSIYREVKTQQVGSTADAVCRTFPAPVRG